MKTFQQFQEQMLSVADKNAIKVAGLKAAAVQRAREPARQNRHARHEIEMKNAREDRERMEKQKNTQPA
jgi:hypothetical protein